MRKLSQLLVGTLVSGVAMSSTVSSTTLSSADRAFEAGDFVQAATAYHEQEARDAKDVHVWVRLGDLALFANRLAEAAHDYRRALALDPENRWATRSLAFVRERLGSGHSYVIEHRKVTAILPFVVTDPLPIVKVRLNNRLDAYFLIDTGSPGIVLDPSTAEAMGLNVPVSIMPMAGAPVSKGMRVEGILGTTFFYHFLTTLDYADGRLILAPRSASHVFEAAAKRSGDSIVPLWYVADHFLFAQARVNDGPPGLFSIDTGGAGIGIQATKATIDDSHIALDYHHERSFTDPGGSVRTVPFTASATIGAISVKGIPGAYLPGGDQYGIFPFTVAGTISHSFFRHLAVTFDFSAMQMVLSRGTHELPSRAQTGFASGEGDDQLR